MTTIYISYGAADMVCAEQIHGGLEAHGYRIWCESASLTMDAVLHPRTVEEMILGSAATIVVWSNIAAQSKKVKQQILFAQQLKKMVVLAIPDGNASPTTLVGVSSIVLHGVCTKIVAQLVPQLPPVDTTDALIALSERVVHQYHSERKAAIEQVAEMLQRGAQREAALALLNYVAQHDPIESVREKAREVLEIDVQKANPVLPSSLPGSNSHTFGVRCEKGHISRFDKRLVCQATIQVARTQMQLANAELDELHLNCTTCGLVVIAHVDCRGYR